MGVLPNSLSSSTPAPRRPHVAATGRGRDFQLPRQFPHSDAKPKPGFAQAATYELMGPDPGICGPGIWPLAPWLFEPIDRLSRNRLSRNRLSWDRLELRAPDGVPVQWTTHPSAEFTARTWGPGLWRFGLTGGKGLVAGRRVPD